MKTQKTILASALLFLGGLALASAQSTAFTYQGRLDISGAPANGHYDFLFRLYDVPTRGDALLGKP